MCSDALFLPYPCPIPALSLGLTPKKPSDLGDRPASPVGAPGAIFSQAVGRRLIHIRAEALGHTTHLQAAAAQSAHRAAGFGPHSARAAVLWVHDTIAVGVGEGEAGGGAEGP